jgi:hypothetical protein
MVLPRYDELRAAERMKAEALLKRQAGEILAHLPQPIGGMKRRRESSDLYEVCT